MNIYRILSGLYYAGLMLILAGIIMHISGASASSWIFGAGLIPVLGVRIYNFIITPGEKKRVNAILLISALFLAAAVVTIYFNRSYWIVFVAISAILDGYVSFRKYT